MSDERRKDDIPKIIAMQRQSQQRFLLFIYAFFSYTSIDGFSLSFVSFQSELRELRRTTRTTNEEELMLQHRHEHHRNSFTVLSISKDNYYDDFAGYGDNKEEDDDHDDDTDTDIDTGDGYIDTDSLGDWRNFRRSLSNIETPDNEDNLINNIDYRDEISKKKNEETLKKHDTKLAEEYATDSWAHVTSTPEVGGIVVRLPLEMELYRNYNHSIMGSRLRDILQQDAEDEGMKIDEFLMNHWYYISKEFIEEEMRNLAKLADDHDQIDATTLEEDYDELLHMYLENQDNWQEVALVIEQNHTSMGNSHYAKTVVLNRPMGWKLTDNLGKLVYFGAYNLKISQKANDKLKRFTEAFESECAVYLGGPNDQGEGSIIIHGIRDLPGAIEISPGSNIYQGGIDAAVDGVLCGKYNPMQFRFFIGCHNYYESRLDVEVKLGKLQPISCQRSLVLKQCKSLPTPLFNEVLQLSGDELANLARLEMLKHESLKFQVVDGNEISDTEDNIYDIEIVDDDDEDFL